MNISGYYCNERQIYTMTTTLDVKGIYPTASSNVLVAYFIVIYAGQNKSLNLFTYSDEFMAYLSKAAVPMPVIIFRRIEILSSEGLLTGRKVMLV